MSRQNELICIRLQPEMNALVREVVSAHSISLSEWIRILIQNALYGVSPHVDEGYIQARALAIKLAHDLLRRAEATMPPTFEDAIVYFGLVERTD